MQSSGTRKAAMALVPAVLLSHETFSRAGPEAFALLNEIAEYVRVCQASRSLEAAAGAAGRRGSPSRTACAD